MGGVVTTVIAEERVPALREAILQHYEAAEDAEVALVEAAAREGRLSDEVVSSVRSLRDAKRSTRVAEAPFEPDAEQRESVAQCVATLVSEQSGLVRMLPVDYYREGIVRNVSVAGAGFLPAP